MALYFLETSALVKLYIREPGTEQMLKLMAGPASHQFAVLAVAQVEFHSALRRRQRAGDLDESAANQLLARFDLHLGTRFLRQGLSDPVIDLACRLLERHPLRAYDALQLSGCLVLKTVVLGVPVFACADQQLLEAAEAEGLTWLDPTA